MKKHIVVYSHGFGVRKDSKGLFTDIAKAIPEAEHVLFDYNVIDDHANTLTVCSLQEDDVISLYGRLSEVTHVTFVLANDDEVLGVTNFAQCDENIALVRINGDHNFSGHAREHVAEIVRCELIAS